MGTTDDRATPDAEVWKAAMRAMRDQVKPEVEPAMEVIRACVRVKGEQHRNEPGCLDCPVCGPARRIVGAFYG